VVVSRRAPYPDARRLGVDGFDGSSLARRAGGPLVLLVAPTRRVGRDAVHLGTFLLDGTDPIRARVARSAAGEPVVRLYVRPDSTLFSGNGAGQSTFDPSNATGLLMPQTTLAGYPEISGSS